MHFQNILYSLYGLKGHRIDFFDLVTGDTTFVSFTSLMCTTFLAVPNQLFCLKCSYAEVRAEQRRELGIEESNPEVTVDKVSSYY